MIEKSVFLISRHPFFDAFEKILMDFYLALSSEGLKVPLEDYLVNMLFKVPAPPRGVLRVGVGLVCKRNPNKEVVV